MTTGIMSCVEGWTGTRAIECPWRAFFDPFVNRVRRAYLWFVEHQLALKVPQPSARLVAGIEHYHRAVKSCEAKSIEQDREQARMQREAARAAAGPHRG